MPPARGYGSLFGSVPYLPAGGCGICGAAGASVRRPGRRICRRNHARPCHDHNQGTGRRGIRHGCGLIRAGSGPCEAGMRKGGSRLCRGPGLPLTQTRTQHIRRNTRLRCSSGAAGAGLLFLCPVAARGEKRAGGGQILPGLVHLCRHAGTVRRGVRKAAEGPDEAPFQGLKWPERERQRAPCCLFPQEIQLFSRQP